MRTTGQAIQMRLLSVIKQKMAEFELYFWVAFVSLLLPLASGELSLIAICEVVKVCST